MEIGLHKSHELFGADPFISKSHIEIGTVIEPCEGQFRHRIHHRRRSGQCVPRRRRQAVSEDISRESAIGRGCRKGTEGKVKSDGKYAGPEVSSPVIRMFFSSSQK